MAAEKKTTISVHVHPNARRSEIARFAEGVWHIRVAAPAAEGKANGALIRFLVEILGLNKTSLSVIRGAKGRQKVIAIAGLTLEQASERLKSGLRANQ